MNSLYLLAFYMILQGRERRCERRLKDYRRRRHLIARMKWRHDEALEAARRPRTTYRLLKSPAKAR